MKSLGASLHLGATARDEGVSFRAWVPRCRTLDVVVEGRRPMAMSRRPDGLFEAAVGGLTAGARYQYRLDGARYRPDPVSRFQPEGVHGPSVVVDPAAFAWTDRAFAGHALADVVAYELHVGAFPGSRNWGYDGVHLFAPQST